jgi:hypothetical protein
LSFSIEKLKQPTTQARRAAPPIKRVHLTALLGSYAPRCKQKIASVFIDSEAHTYSPYGVLSFREATKR